MLGARKLEATFSREVRAALARLTILTFKVNERVRRGIPDIYIQGGNWIESKVIPTMPGTRNFPLKYFTALQRITMDTLCKRGDNCFVAILWYGEDSRSLLFMPWHQFRRIKSWDVYTLAHFSAPYIGPASMDLTKFCWEKGRWNGARWKAEIFDTWVQKDNIRVYDAKYVPDELTVEEPSEEEADELA
jgi:hypothetical protein